MEDVLASSDSKTTYDLVSLLQPPKEGLYRCRVLYSASSCEVEYIPYVKREVKRLRLVTHNSIEYSQKSANREALNLLFAQREGCDDVLIVKNGLITDTTIANVAFFDGKRWLTPRVPLLKGTTRERLLEAGVIVAEDITPEMINGFKKLALMNAMIDFDIIAEENIREIIC